MLSELIRIRTRTGEHDYESSNSPISWDFIVHLKLLYAFGIELFCLQLVPDRSAAWSVTLKGRTDIERVSE